MSSPSFVLTIPGTLSSGDVERLREQWRRAYSDPHRAIILDPGMRVEYLGPAPLRAPAQIDPLPLPIPFRWGPNGAFLLLLAMLAAYAVVVVILWRAAA